MAVFTDKNEIKGFASTHGLHLALGYFDGVHLGHQGILGQTLSLSTQQGGEAGVLLLEPHPQKVLGMGMAPRVLNSLDEKIRLIQAFGDVHIFILDFDIEMAGLSPEAFVRDFLVGLFHVRTAVCGYNYHFGHRGQGDSAVLERLGAAHGFSCRVLPQITHQGDMVSSSAIRSLIDEGAMFEAYARLGHAHVFSGSVVGGKHIGGRLGFPTANLDIGSDKVWPAYGVYGGFLRDGEGRVFRGIVNAGVRPTVDPDSSCPSFEAYLLDFQGDLYGSRLQAVLTDRLRPEKAFSGLDALKEQIARDTEQAKSALAGWESALAGEGLALESLFACFIRDYPV
jgi:riboflavin kinase/FMN adenylyltransferase